MNIFDKPYYPLSYFSNEVFVRCPGCYGLGLVTADRENLLHVRNSSARFRCLQSGCPSGEAGEWAGYYVGFIGLSYKGGACAFCGTTFQKEFSPTRTPYKHANARCPACGQEMEYEVNWYRYHGSAPTDPFFGYDLFYQKAVKKGILWVYNREHLEYLREYLNAGVRNRESASFYSMVARLPVFIKSAKNRQAITRQLDEFEKEIIRNRI